LLTLSRFFASYRPVFSPFSYLLLFLFGRLCGTIRLLRMHILIHPSSSSMIPLHSTMIAFTSRFLCYSDFFFF
jgi:hypothetical protein